MPTGDVTGLRGVDLGVRDVAAHARFFTDVWRLTITAERNGSVYLRGSGAYCHILALHPRSESAILCLNFTAANRDAVERLHARVTAAGTPQAGKPGEIGEPGGGYGFTFLDPEGRSVRLIAGDARHADACVVPDRPERITHVVLNTACQEVATAFWVQALGFQISDRSMLTFIRCNDDHHSIAFHPAAGRGGNFARAQSRQDSGDLSHGKRRTDFWRNAPERCRIRREPSA